jgi:DNA-binding MarR family transcriptional regulator
LLKRFLSDGEKVYRSRKIDFAISWFPVFHILAHRSPLTLTEIANALGMAHPSIIEVTDEMIKKGFVESQRSQEDRRRRHLLLTKKGEKTVARLEPIWEAFKQAADEACRESANDFWESIRKMEQALDRRSMYERITSRLNKKNL